MRQASGFVTHERRAANPLLDVRLFRMPAFSVGSRALVGRVPAGGPVDEAWRAQALELWWEPA